MTPNLRRANAAEDTLKYLRLARDAAREADTPRTLARIRAAMKSAEGAMRHLDGLCSRDRAKLFGELLKEEVTR